MPTPPRPPAIVALRYSQLEELLAGLVDVDDDRLPAFAARLKLFRQRDFPPIENPTSKRRFTYDLDAVLRLATALALMEAMVPQDAVPSLVESSWAEIRTAFQDSFTLVAQLGEEEAARSPKRQMLVISSHGLSTFRRPRGSVAAQDATISIAVADSLCDRWREPNPEPMAPVTVIDIQHLANWIREGLVGSGWVSNEQFKPGGT